MGRNGPKWAERPPDTWQVRPQVEAEATRQFTVGLDAPDAEIASRQISIYLALCAVKPEMLSRVLRSFAKATAPAQAAAALPPPPPPLLSANATLGEYPPQFAAIRRRI